MSNQFISKDLKELICELKKNDVSRLLLITGKNSYFKANYKEVLEDSLKSLEVIHFYEVFPNPKIEELEVGIQAGKDANYDACLAVGGGSVIDSAKIINFFCAQSFSIREYFKSKKDSVSGPKPLTAIPTTSGTGSESTQFATLYINKVKNSLDHKLNLPKLVLLDPIFSKDLPTYITAYTGADALCQAIESYWSVNSTEESLKLAGQAIKLLNDNLLQTLENPSSNEHRLNMAIGANLAGQAIQITKTTAPHAISYPMTSFFDIPHGEAVSISLPHIFEFNYNLSETDLADKRGSEFVKNSLEEISNLLQCKSVIEAKQYLITLFEKAGLKTKLDLKEEDLITIVDNGFNPDRVKNNPRVLTRETLLNILKSIN